MKWMHGELLDREKVTFPFRYSFDDDMTPQQCVEKIQTCFIRGSVVLWIEEGFIPKDTERFGDFTMAEPNEFSELTVEFRPDPK